MRLIAARPTVAQRAAAAVLSLLLFGNVTPIPWAGSDPRAVLSAPSGRKPAAPAARAAGPADGVRVPGAGGAVGGVTDPGPQGVRLRVMTYNIRYGKGLDGRVDLERAAQTIQAEAPDILVLQEVDRHNPRSGVVDQARWLSERLGMAVVYGPSMRLGPTAYGNAVLSRFPVETWRMVPLPSGLEPRSLLKVWVRLDDGALLEVWTTHFGLNSDERRRQALAVAAMLDAPRDAPLILAGDLNSRPDREPVAILTRWLVDVHAAVGRAEGYTFPFGGDGAPNVRIDYVFAGPGVAPLRTWVPESDSSDHRPVVAEVKVVPLAPPEAEPDAPAEE